MDTLEMFAKLSQIGFEDEVGSPDALLKRLTKDELEILEIERSWDWCGTDWEEKDKARIKKILRARTNDLYSLKKTDYEIISQLEAKLYKEPHFMKKIFSFLFR